MLVHNVIMLHVIPHFRQPCEPGKQCDLNHGYREMRFFKVGQNFLIKNKCSATLRRYQNSTEICFGLPSQKSVGEPPPPPPVGDPLASMWIFSAKTWIFNSEKVFRCNMLKIL